MIIGPSDNTLLQALYEGRAVDDALRLAGLERAGLVRRAGAGWELTPDGLEVYAFALLLQSRAPAEGGT